MGLLIFIYTTCFHKICFKIDEFLTLTKLHESISMSGGDPRELVGIKNDLVHFVNDPSLDKNRKFIFENLVNEISNTDFFLAKNKNILDTEFKMIEKILEDKQKRIISSTDEVQLTKSYKSIINILGKETASDILLTSRILGGKILKIPEKDFSDEITNEINRFENSKWKGSPFLFNLYYNRCLNSTFKKKYKLLIRDSGTLKIMYDLILKKSDIEHLTQISFLMFGLSGEDRHIECIDLFKTIPKNWLEADESFVQGARCRVYGAVANSYWKTGKKQTALAYQEMAATIALSHFSDGENFIVKDNANILRDMYVQIGDWKSLRNLEVRFKLKPLPQNPAEK